MLYSDAGRNDFSKRQTNVHHINVITVNKFNIYSTAANRTQLNNARNCHRNHLCKIKLADEPFGSCLRMCTHDRI